MEKQDYHSSIEVKISPKEAYDKIAQVGDWWATSFKGQAQNVGDTFNVKMSDTTVDFKIIEAIPGKKIVWEITDCFLHWLNDKTEWKGTKIVWEISTQNGFTQVDMTHVGIIPGIECYNDCVRGWNGYIQKSLFNLLTENKGLPDKF